MRTRAAIAGLLLAATVTLPDRASADEDAAPLRASLALDGAGVSAAFDVTGAFTEGFRKRITNGLRNLALIEVTLVDPSGQPIAQALRHCHFKYEVWDEVLEVRVREAGRRFERQHQVFDRGLRECGQISQLALGELSAMTSAGAYRLEVAVLLNPVDQETLQSAREFLSNPRGTRPGRPLTLFGTVARLFSDKPEAGGERFRFRSGPLYRPRRT